jgi:hypothetical protein
MVREGEVTVREMIHTHSQGLDGASSLDFAVDFKQLQHSDFQHLTLFRHPNLDSRPPRQLLR